jgi:DNA-binding NtrC family response regulator
MVVDDDPMIMRLVTQMLAFEDGVVVRQGGCDVRALMHDSAWADVHVAVVDLLMPQTTGDELLVWLGEHAPHVRRIAMSGAGRHRLDESVHAEVRLLKPFSLDELLTALHA